MDTVAPASATTQPADMHHPHRRRRNLRHRPNQTRHPHRTVRRHQAERVDSGWSPTQHLVRVALFALAAGSTAWSLRWAWRTIADA
jgi:hypothetical protein